MNPLAAASTIALLVLAGAAALAEGAPEARDSFRVLSWNISNDAFVKEPGVFRSLVAWADPDVVLLDEVSPSAETEVLLDLLNTLRPEKEQPWTLHVGTSGGQQRGVIASRSPIQPLAEFSAPVRYPDTARQSIVGRMSPEERDHPRLSMATGIPVTGALIIRDNRRLLVVTTDLQCCGAGPDSWQEFRRRVEAREIRTLIRRAVAREQPDGVIFAGDFNLVGSTFPFAILTGPYPAPHDALIPAELHRPGDEATWTWDGRGTPFPSNTLDYQFYGPYGLEVLDGFIVDTEGLPPGALAPNALEQEDSLRTGRHRPLLVEYAWRR